LIKLVTATWITFAAIRCCAAALFIIQPVFECKPAQYLVCLKLRVIQCPGNIARPWLWRRLLRR
jgi:hypothetical protein